MQTAACLESVQGRRGVQLKWCYVSIIIVYVDYCKCSGELVLLHLSIRVGEK